MRTIQHDKVVAMMMTWSVLSVPGALLGDWIAPYWIMTVTCQEFQNEVSAKRHKDYIMFFGRTPWEAEVHSDWKWS